MRPFTLHTGSLRGNTASLLVFATIFAVFEIAYITRWSSSIKFLKRNQDFRNDTGITQSFLNRDRNAYDVTKLEPSPTPSPDANSKLLGKVISLTLRNNTDTDFTSAPLMLLFSSWSHSRDKAPVHAAVFRLWSAWPHITNAVVTTDPVVKRHAKRAGWHVEPITHVHRDCHGPPVLAPMFTQIMFKYDAHYYGFSNSDILFGNGLEETLNFLYEHDAWRTKPLLIVGRRYNVDFLNSTNVNLETPKDVEELTERGTLVLRSTDYFFTNRHFPWNKVPEVSIGRPYVVRAIIGFALKRKIAVIEATKTIEAVHLTTKDGIFASWHKTGVKCNEKIMASIHWSVPTKIGHCECALLETFKEHGEMKVRHRKANKQICS